MPDIRECPYCLGEALGVPTRALSPCGYIENEYVVFASGYVRFLTPGGMRTLSSAYNSRDKSTWPSELREALFKAQLLDGATL